MLHSLHAEAELSCCIWQSCYVPLFLDLVQRLCTDGVLR